MLRHFSATLRPGARLPRLTGYRLRNKKVLLSHVGKGLANRTTQFLLECHAEHIESAVAMFLTDALWTRGLASDGTAFTVRGFPFHRIVRGRKSSKNTSA
jgi:hypothetical protein